MTKNTKHKPALAAIKNQMEKIFNNLSIKEYQLQIQFTGPVTFPYFHGQKLNHLLCKALGVHPLGENILIFPTEIGRINYKEGELYNFGLTVLGQETNIIERIKNGLHSESEKEKQENHFRGNFILRSFEKINNQTFLQPENKKKQFILQFITPLRMKLKNAGKKKLYFSPNNFDAEKFLKLLYNRIYDLGKLSGAKTEEYIEPEIPTIKVKHKTLIWVDVPYSKTLGGVIGKVVLEGELNEFWQRVLWYGQLIHAGNLSAFGFGKYVLLNTKNTIEYIKPAATLLDKILEAQNLIDSVHHIKLRSDKDSYGRKKIIEYESDLLNNLNKLVEKVKNKKYNPGNLTGIILPKGNSKVRALAIPPLNDKILQRATTQIISPSIDQLLEESSFAYRKGFSRQSAARTISKAQKDGYKFVFKSDINSFFDNVDWEILFEKLDVLFFNDPILKLLKKWIVQSVEYKGKVIERNKGLPQGLPISPVLANLFLDEFDEALQDNFKLIRFADDFLILCKSKDALLKAKAEADKTLEKMKLELKDSKTEETTFDNGFQYLGYLFVKSLIMEKNKDEAENLKVETKFQIPSGSWLNYVDLQNIKPIENFSNKNDSKVKLLHPHLREQHKIPIYISNPKLSVYLNDESLIIQNKTDNNYDDKRIPISKILFLVFIGRARVTLPSVIKLRDRGVPTYFLRANGKLYLTISSEVVNYSFWQKQAELFNNTTFALELTKKIITAQIHNYKVIARRMLTEKDLLSQFSFLEKEIDLINNIDELRGYEGRSAAILYSIIKKAIPGEWNFTHRTKHPPEDAVNVMLSIGFTILYNHIATALQMVGLNPEIGFYHKPKPYHFALASDIIEEFRHIIISHVLYLIHRKIISINDFYKKENTNYPCQMRIEPRKKFIASVEERLNEKFNFEDETEPVTYKYYFYLKAKMIKELLTKPDEDYQPFRIR